MTDIYYIDLRTIHDRESLYDKIMEILPLPKYCGRNLDALYDAFTGELSDCRIFLLGREELEEQLEGYATVFLNMCREADEANPTLQIFSI